MVQADGRALIVENNLDAVVRLDPATGEVTVVSDADTGVGQLFDGPGWIALEEDGQILVTDLFGVYRVDPVSGHRLLLSGPRIEFTGGSLGGVEFPAEVTCRNLTTGQVVKGGVDAGTTWDCRKLGLDIEEGDQIFTGARAIR